jgi:DNA-binding NtrC family response regulator
LYKKTLLCIEKDGRRLSARCAALEAAGYKVIAVNNVAEALKIFVSQTIDAVLLDAKFGTRKSDSPGVLMSTIRPHVPIVVMRGETAHVRNGVFTQVFRKRDGNRALLRILEEVIGPRASRCVNPAECD